MRDRLVSIQILRFVAAVLVVFSHAVTHSGGALAHLPVSQAGAVGVDVFFVISGFIITRIGFMGADQPTPAAFYRRRWLRVVPIYLLVTALWIVLRPLPTQPDAQAIVTTLTFWPAYADQVRFPLLGVGWTLCFEMLFYTAVALVIATGRPRVGAIGLIVAFSLCNVARIVTGWPVFQFLGNPIILEFLFGIGIALYWRQVTARGLAAASIGAALALFILVCIAGVHGLPNGSDTLNGLNSTARVLRFGVPAGLLVLGFLHLEAMLKGRLASALARLGDASYALYLVHPLVLHLLRRPLDSFGPCVGVSVEIGASILAGLAVHHFAEKPLLGVLRRPLRRPVLAPAG